MSDLGWRADGIQRARAAGGVELEVYRRPGFAGGTSVRRVRSDVSGGGFGIELDPPQAGGAEARDRRSKRRG